MKHFVIGLAVFAGVAALAGAQVLPIGPLPVVSPAPLHVQALPPALEARPMQQEQRLPEGHYCTPRPRAKNAHECHCDYVCHEDQSFNETSECLTYCKRDQCTCHPEEPCPKPGAAQ